MPLATFMKMKGKHYRDPKLSAQHQITFFHRLSHILGKGYPLLEALKITGWDPRLKPTADILTSALGEGDSIHTACQRARFSSTATNFLYFSHVNHDLPKVFTQCKDLLEMKKSYKERFFQVIRYPLFLFVFLIIAFLLLQKTVMPNFLTLFAGQENRTLSIMFGMTHVMNALGVIMILFFFMLLSLKFILPKLPLQRKLHVYEKIPLLKMFQSFSLSFLFTTHLHSLLQAGLTLKESMELMEKHHQYDILSHYSRNILSELSEGKTFAQALYHCPLFRYELTNIFHHTNDMKALQHELEMLADFFMDYIEEKIRTWLQLIQPIFFVCIAIVIISIYASIMLPLYQWMNQI